MKKSKSKNLKNSKNQNSKNQNSKNSKNRNSKNSKNRNSKNSKNRNSKNSKNQNSKNSKNQNSKNRNLKNSKNRNLKNSKNRNSKNSKNRNSKNSKNRNSKNSKNRNSKNSKNRKYNFFDSKHPEFPYTSMGDIEYNQETNEIKTYVYIGPNDKLTGDKNAFSCDRLTFEILPLKTECGANGCIHLAKVKKNPCSEQVWWLPENSIVVIKLDLYRYNRFSDEKYKFDIVTQQLNGKDIVINQYGLFWSKIEGENMKNLLNLFKFKITKSSSRFALFQIMEYFKGSSASKLLKKYNYLRYVKYEHEQYKDRIKNNIIYNKIKQNLCRKIKELHDLGFVHGDIHLDNILVNEDSLDTRLIDLGTLKIIREYDDYQDPWINEFEGGGGDGNDKFFYWNQIDPYFYPPWKETYKVCKSV